ncbi:MAG: hypothetical protein JWM44_956 [Bacilli bacterium]|nr:hypothetical protein [Bacilli bacterium]
MLDQTIKFFSIKILCVYLLFGLVVNSSYLLVDPNF